MPPDWFIDEVRHAGTEHLDADQVARYDEKIPFDPSDEIELLREHGLSTGDTVVDFGTGTGVFPLAVAEHCDRVVGIDVSETMLDVARGKAAERGVENVEFVHEGMVRYSHEGAPASFVFSKNALHHLPDFWKVEALKTIGETLEPGGVFRFHDLVYSFDPAESHERIEDWLAGMDGTLFTDEELHDHFREEFSTYDFLMEPMLDRAGFDVLEAT
ncbi:MAG: class I SAM-dependent methyltransferase, partial [Halobacteriales archaeon]|nr:class I SAM-dependent methyltransferase [Halobacteriales archaeon]